MHDGWYITGDLASMDEDGFITIRDCLSRFSKIGGEMISHLKVEEEIHTKDCYSSSPSNSKIPSGANPIPFSVPNPDLSLQKELSNR